MVRLGISVEGQTEERFVKDVLAPHLAGFDVFAEAKIVATGWTANGARAKGGGINLGRISRELKTLLPSFRQGYVTSLYDLYGFEDRLSGETAAALESRIAQATGAPPNLIPYIQQYEFETLLLACPTTAADYFQAPGLAATIKNAVASAGGAEQVNDGRTTAPSKRLESWTAAQAPALMRFSKKTKVRHGATLCERITLATIRTACPRFDGWLKRLEALQA
ncbi:DUF4276 family protein [Asticcacaulis sp.]|uniref:DUF4276 family protein n=1 Tax=Asticcacaulis sp. TaxID=1872648 RepID=UPI00261AE64B|nr:DUF4276 family protein [Asticcacaulis sp.]